VEFLPDSGHAVPSESGETMSRRPRRNHTPAFKAKVALAAIKGGAAHLNRGEYALALEDLNQSIRLAGGDATAIYNRGATYFFLQEYENASSRVRTPAARAGRRSGSWSRRGDRCGCRRRPPYAGAPPRPRSGIPAAATRHWVCALSTDGTRASAKSSARSVNVQKSA